MLTTRDHFSVCKQFTTSLILLTSSLITYLIKHNLEKGVSSNFITAAWEVIPCTCFLCTRRLAVVQVNQVIKKPNNFCGLSLAKTDHLTQIRTMVTRGYSLSHLISVVGRKTKKQANAQAKLLIGQAKPKEEYM